LTPASPSASEALPLLPALRQAARVSVIQSATQRGLYLLRVLQDGEPPSEGSAEAYVVFVDPSTTVLRSGS